MNKKTGYFDISHYSVIMAICFILTCCSTQQDYSGIYELSAGNCSSRFITLKKVKGFGKKYYIVKIYKDDYLRGEGTEFLGVVKGNTISVKDGSIIIKDSSLSVSSGNKTCTYVLQDDGS